MCAYALVNDGYRKPWPRWKICGRIEGSIGKLSELNEAKSRKGLWHWWYNSSNAEIRCTCEADIVDYYSKLEIKWDNKTEVRG